MRVDTRLQNILVEAIASWEFVQFCSSMSRAGDALKICRPSSFEIPNDPPAITSARQCPPESARARQR